MSSTVEVCLPDGLRPAETAGLCAVVAARLAAGDVVLCCVERVAGDLAVVDALARLQLTARRAGASVSVHRPRAELLELLELLGLQDLLS